MALAHLAVAAGCRQAPPDGQAQPTQQAQAPAATTPGQKTPGLQATGTALAPGGQATAPEATQSSVQPATGTASAPASPAPAATSPSATSPGGDPAASSAPRTEPAPAPPPAPEFHEFIVPAGTALSVVLDTTVSSGDSAVEDTVRGHLANSVRIDETKVLPAGSKLVGTVVEAQGAGKVKGRGRIAFRFDRITAHGEDYRAPTSVYAAQASATKGKDAKKIGIGAGAGAIIGGIIGGGKGAAIGAGVGGGAGTGVVLATKGEEATVAAGAQVRVTLQESLTVRVPAAAK
jgi:hypothetical protein